MKTHSDTLDYLVIGHITRDLIGDDFTIGGTVTYSGLCARNLGLRIGCLTACEPDLESTAFDNIQLTIIPSKTTTTFENIETNEGRKQFLHQIAPCITADEIKKHPQKAKIVHLGPVAGEIEKEVINCFPEAFIALTPQGWMRQRDQQNIVHYKPWENAEFLLHKADAVVLSIEDVGGDHNIIEQYAATTKVMAVTEGYRGAAVYWNGDVRHFSAPKVPLVDATGAGDIFAAVFFSSLFHTKDPWESARRAVVTASDSVRRVGIKGVPTSKQMRSLQIEIIQGK